MSIYICAVCRDYLENPSDITPDDEVEDYDPVFTFCGHVFHDGCISQWLEHQKDSNNSYSCPVCSGQIKEGDLVPLNLIRGEGFVNYRTLLSQVESITQSNAILKDKLVAEKESLVQLKEKQKETQERVQELKEYSMKLKRKTLEIENQRLKIKLAELQKRLMENKQNNNAC